MGAGQRAQAFVGFGLAGRLVFLLAGRANEPAGVLLIAFWALNLPELGGELAALARQYPMHRNLVRHLLEPLDAPEPDPAPGPDGDIARAGRRHEGEDRGLARYLDASRDLDRAAVALQVLVPRGWLLAGLAALAPAFLTDGGSPGSLAVGVGGLVLAYRALRDLADGVERVTAAAVAWARIAPFWRASARREPVGDPRFAAPIAGRGGASLLDVRDLVFRHRDREEPVLRGVSVRIQGGDRLLLEGPSGGGKPTLAALLAGCRLPDAGLLLLDGLDRETVGAGGWRRRVVLAPQSHENHVFMGTLTFNALMGRDWPPRPAYLAEAERVCRALGLGPLLDRMPAGLHQVVGETGWQLSHGEKGRLYIARALLQGADLLILDESFAALDPRTLRRTLACVEERARTVLLIAHP